MTHGEPVEVSWRQLVAGDYVQAPNGDWLFITSVQEGRVSMIDAQGKTYATAQPSDFRTVAKLADDSEAIETVAALLHVTTVSGTAIYPPVGAGTDKEWLRAHLEHVHGIKVEPDASFAYMLASHDRDAYALVAHTHRPL